MTTQRSVLMCLSGLDPVAFIDRAAPHIPGDRPLVLLYVVDTRPIEQLGYLRQRLFAPFGGSAERDEQLTATDERIGEDVLNEALARCAGLGYDPQAITPVIRHGHPEHEIVATAQQQELNIGLVVIGANYKGGPNALSGPASVGPVARFVVDHSPCDVLLLR